MSLWSWLNEPLFTPKKVVAKTLAADVAVDVPKEILKGRKDGELPSLPDADVYKNLAQAMKLNNQLPPIPFNPYIFQDPQTVISAVTSHVAGQFQQSGILSQALASDPKIWGPLSIRVNALVGLDFKFTPANNSAKAREMAEMCRLYFRRWFPAAEHAKFHRDLITMGFSRAQMVFLPLKDDGVLFRHPEIHTWSPGSYLWWYWDPKRRFGRYLQSDLQGVVEPVPGDGEWVFGTMAAWQPWLEGLIMALGLKYAERLSLSLDATKFGMTIAKGRYVYTGPVQLDVPGFQQFLDTVSNPNNPNIILPSGATGNEWKADYVGPNAAGAKDFYVGMLTEFGMECSELILGQNLTSQVGTGGSHAAIKGAQLVRQDVMEFDAEIEANIIHEQILKPIAVMNYQDADLAPFVEIVTDPPADLVAKASALKDLGTFLQTAGGQKSGQSGEPGSEPTESINVLEDVDMDALLADFDVPLTVATEDAPASEDVT